MLKTNWVFPRLHQELSSSGLTSFHLLEASDAALPPCGVSQDTTTATQLWDILRDPTWSYKLQQKSTPFMRVFEDDSFERHSENTHSLGSSLVHCTTIQLHPQPATSTASLKEEVITWNLYALHQNKIGKGIVAAR